MLKLIWKTSKGGVKNRDIWIDTFNDTFTEIFIWKKFHENSMKNPYSTDVECFSRNLSYIYGRLRTDLASHFGPEDRNDLGP